MSIRILLVDDHPVVRAGVRALLSTEPDLEVIAEAADAAEAVAAVQRDRPDLVLMDLRLGDGPGGVEATRSIRGLPDAPAVLVLTNYDTDAHILGAVEAGASGYLLKDAPPAELLAAIRAAAAGASALAPAIAGRLLDRMRSPHLSLTARELEVLRVIGRGVTNAEAAALLHLSETTVKSHLAHVNTKLDVTTRTAAVAEARRRGWID